MINNGRLVVMKDQVVSTMIKYNEYDEYDNEEQW